MNENDSDELHKLIREEARKAICESHGKPRSDSSSKYRRDDPRYENERQRRDKTFPGHDDFERLANGIMEAVDDELSKVEEGSQPKHCYTTQQIMNLRQRIYQQILDFMSDLEDVKKKGYWKTNKQARLKGKR
tara:strand:- start:1322 stop:1720 length:399 start_codon:yes stop_codon:yes gene_type:complete